MCVHVCKGIYCEQLAHTVVEADRSQDLQSASWGIGKAKSLSPSLNTGSLKIQGLRSQFKSEGRKRMMSELQEAMQENSPLTHRKVGFDVLFRPFD